MEGNKTERKEGLGGHEGGLRGRRGVSDEDKK